MGIQRKEKQCKKCGKDSYIFSKGLCKYCYTKSKPKSKPRKRKSLGGKRDSIPSLKKRARYWFQRWIRYRDLGEKCICESCDNYLTDIRNFDAGHYHKAELYSNLIFDEDNVHGCCKGCNGFRDGNIIEYRKGLVKKIGESRVVELEQRAHYNKETYKWNREFLSGIISKYKALVHAIEDE